jgi:type IV pilus assembly protein PilB
MLDHQNVAELLSRTALFAGLQPSHLEAIAKVTKLVIFEAKSTVVRQGEGGSELYILAKGSVAVVREDPALGIEHVVKELRAPEFFGEMSLLGGSVRTATIRTLEETACVVLAAASYESILEKIPVVAVQISRYLAHRLDHQMGLMGFRFARQEELIFDPELYATFSQGLLRRHKAIPLRLDGPTLTVAMTRPHDIAAVSALRQELPGLGLQPVACAEEDYEAFLQRHLPPASPATFSTNIAFTQADGQAFPSPLTKLLSHLAQSGRVVVDVSSGAMTLNTASSGGLLEPLEPDCEQDASATAQALEDLFGSANQDSEVRNLTVLAGGKRCSLSLSRLQTVAGPRYGLELTDPRAAVPEPAFLWPTEALRATVEKAVCGGGAVLVCGNGRSGRSTTLYSLLRMLKREGANPNLISLESEPLATLEGVAQVRLASDLGRCQSEELSRVLKVALAQGPSVLLVDEPRAEDLGKLLEAAEDGLTVLTTLKGSTPLTVLASLGERYAGSLSQADNLKLLIGQQLLRRICGYCRQEYSPSPPVLAQLEQAGLGTRTDRYFRGAGCSSCRGSGTLGRVASFELVQMNGLLSEMLRGGRSVEAIRKAASSNGLLFSFKSFARLLTLHGQILPTEALRLYGGVSGS